MKKIALGLFVLGLLCIGLYFVLGPSLSEVTVFFNSNGGTSIEAQVLKNGEKATKPQNPTKENSEFIEWQLDGKEYNFDDAVTSSITLNAKWKEFSAFTVKVTVDGTEYSAQVKDGEALSVDSLGITIEEGYRLALYNGEEVYNISDPVTSDLTLTGKLVEIKKYKVTFNSNGGSKVEAQQVIEENTISEPSTSRDGYDFAGWYLNNVKFDFTTPITKSITLTAKWTEKGKINVIFMTDSKVYKTIAVKEGTKVSKPANPTKKGYKFVEWQLDGTKFDFNTKIMQETTLTATFEEVSAYTVKFDSDGGTKIKDVEVEAGTKLKAPTNPTKSGYKFIEWQIKSGNTYKKYDFSKVVESDITLKAKWEKLVKYTVTFNSNGGSNVASQSVVAGEKATKPSVTKEGFRLESWLLDNKPFDFSTPITKDITLTARWVSNEANNPDVPDVPGLPDTPDTEEEGSQE